MQSKHFVFIGTVALLTASGAAEPEFVTTRNGITYTNAVIQRADPDGLVIEYVPQPGSFGIAKLKFANLTDELRQRYNYSAGDALIFEQNHAAGIARRQEEIAQGEAEKKRRQDELAQQRAEKAAEQEARQQQAAAMAAMVAAQMPMGGWYGGGYGYGDWSGGERRRYRFSPGPVKSLAPETRVDSTGFSSGTGLGWSDSGHWGPVPSQALGGPSRGGTFRSPAARGSQ